MNHISYSTCLWQLALYHLFATFKSSSADYLIKKKTNKYITNSGLIISFLLDSSVSRFSHLILLWVHFPCSRQNNLLNTYIRACRSLAQTPSVASLCTHMDSVILTQYLKPTRLAFAHHPGLTLHHSVLGSLHAAMPLISSSLNLAIQSTALMYCASYFLCLQ